VRLTQPCALLSTREQNGLKCEQGLGEGLGEGLRRGMAKAPAMGLAKACGK